jgi:prolyl 4-hydroxylase
MNDNADPRLSELIRVYDDALDPELCARIIEQVEADPAEQFQRAQQRTWVEYVITRNPNPQWREIERALIENMVRHLAEYATLPVAGMLARKSPRAFEHLKLKKYRVGGDDLHHFPLHVDVFDHRSAVRTVAFLWYLNTVEEGGETVFPVLGTRVAARAGRLVIMPPYWMYEHAGEPPVSEDKYILTSYVNFRDPDDDFRFSYPIR